MLYLLVLLVTTISIITAASLPYSYMIGNMPLLQQRQQAFAQGDGDSEGLSNGADSTERVGDPIPDIGSAVQSEVGDSGNSTALETMVPAESNGEENELEAPTGDQNITQSEGDQCTGDFALDPTTGECDPTGGPCPEGETRGESGFCAVMPEECPPGTYIDEDPLCEPCPTEGQIPEECNQPDEIQPPQSEPEPVLLTNGTTTNQTGNTTFVTINNAIAQAFSSTTYNTRVLQQAAQNTLLVGEETVPLQGLIKPNGTRLLSTFDPFKLIGGSAIVNLPTSNISSSPLSTFVSVSSDRMQILALDGDSNDVVTLPSTKMPIQGNANGYKTVLGGAFEGINPFTGQQVNVDNIKALFLFNGLNQTVTFGYGSSVALLTIVR
jgi:hypothetical protein